LEVGLTAGGAETTTGGIRLTVTGTEDGGGIIGRLLFSLTRATDGGGIISQWSL